VAEKRVSILRITEDKDEMDGLARRLLTQPLPSLGNRMICLCHVRLG
jgi:hypothetical protein